MAVRDALDADFNASSREIECKLEIFFDVATPLTVEKDDYLIDMEILEELSAEGVNPLGSISSNELQFTLLNLNGIFCPAKADGPYYGKIKLGIKVIPYFRPVNAVDTVNWIQMGTYYVSDWNAMVTGSYADVTARDNLQAVFDKSAQIDVPVVANQTFKQLYDSVFVAISETATVDASLSTVIPFGYAQGTPKETLKEISVGAVALCTCNKQGDIIVDKLNKVRALRATMTDANQLISADIQQSIIKTYNGVELTYKLPQIADGALLLEVQDINIPAGAFPHSFMTFSQGPAKGISNVTITSTTEDVQITAVKATPWGISVTTQNVGATEVKGTLTVYGTLISFVDTVLSDLTSNMFQLTNKYIQTPVYASVHKGILRSFVDSDLPVLKTKIRGNPLLSLADKVRVQSTKYGLDFTGIVQRFRYTFNGALSCEMTLLNSTIVEGLPV